MSTENPSSPRFRSGHVRVTSGIAELVASGALNLQPYFDRHLRGDWGEVPPYRRHANQEALAHGGQLFSEYSLTQDHKLWIITEGDRSVTTLLLIRTVQISS